MDARHVLETGEVHTVFSLGGMMEREHLEVLGVDGRILKFVFKKWNGGWGDLQWIYLPQNRDTWYAVEKAVRNLWVPLKAGNLLTF